MARRDEGAYCRYVTEEQRSQPGCIDRESDRVSHSRGLSRRKPAGVSVGHSDTLGALQAERCDGAPMAGPALGRGANWASVISLVIALRGTLAQPAAIAWAAMQVQLESAGDAARSLALLTH